MKLKTSSKEIYVILLDVRSVFNVGSIFRTADASGVSKIFLVGITPTPSDRFGRARKDFEKVSLGAEKSVAWEYRPEILPLTRKLKQGGIRIVAVEQSKNSMNYKKLKIFSNTAFVFGNEVNGLPASILKNSDAICEIPMRGTKESLNVSVAVGIVLFNVI